MCALRDGCGKGSAPPGGVPDGVLAMAGGQWTRRRNSGISSGCPSYKFRPAQKSGPFRVVPDSVCDPHTILLHGVLSNFRSRAMRQLEIIAPLHQLDVLRRNQRIQSLETPKTPGFLCRTEFIGGTTA